MCVKITSTQYVDSVIKIDKTIEVYKLLAICRDVFCGNQTTRKGQKNVSVQNVQINNCSYTKKRKKEDSSLYGGCKLFLSEDQFEVVRIDCNIASISLFRVNIPLSSESILFGAKMTRMESDNKIELRKILKSLHLPPSQHFGSRKIFKVFIIHNNIDGIDQIF